MPAFYLCRPLHQLRWSPSPASRWRTPATSAAHLKISL